MFLTGAGTASGTMVDSFGIKDTVADANRSGGETSSRTAEFLAAGRLEDEAKESVDGVDEVRRLLSSVSVGSWFFFFRFFPARILSIGHKEWFREAAH